MTIPEKPRSRSQRYRLTAKGKAWLEGQKASVTDPVTQEVSPEVTQEVGRLLLTLTGEMPRHELQGALGLKDDEHFRVTYILPALQTGWIEMTIPDKPRSRRQRYRLTANGKEWVARKRRLGGGQ